jgi:hypothetical protein
MGNPQGGICVLPVETFSTLSLVECATWVILKGGCVVALRGRNQCDAYLDRFPPFAEATGWAGCFTRNDTHFATTTNTRIVLKKLMFTRMSEYSLLTGNKRGVVHSRGQARTRNTTINTAINCGIPQRVVAPTGSGVRNARRTYHNALILWGILIWMPICYTS